MAHRSPALRLARRMRQKAALRNASGLVLVDVRLNDAGVIDQNHEMLVLPVSVTYVSETLNFLNWEHYPEPFETAKKTFINRLACHPDARLRAAAAAADVMNPDVARELAQDSAYAVRRAIARNDATVQLSPPWLTGSMSIIMSVLIPPLQ